MSSYPQYYNTRRLEIVIGKTIGNIKNFIPTFISEDSLTNVFCNLKYSPKQFLHVVLTGVALKYPSKSLILTYGIIPKWHSWCQDQQRNCSSVEMVTISYCHNLQSQLKMANAYRGSIRQRSHTVMDPWRCPDVLIPSHASFKLSICGPYRRSARPGD